MKTRPLGRGGPEVPVIGLGSWPIGGGMGVVDEAIGIATVRAAIDSGLTLVDTAARYQASEDVVGKALRDGYRQRCFLATKAQLDHTPTGLRQSLEASLRALGTDVIDLYQIHHWRPEFPLEPMMETLLAFQAEGKVRYLGMSNYVAEQMDRVRAFGHVQANQLGYNMLQRTYSETIDFPYSLEHGIGVLAHSSLAKGLLTGKYRATDSFSDTDERAEMAPFQGEAFRTYVAVANALGAVARDLEASLVQLAIAWILRQPAVACVLVGAKSPAQAADYVAAAELAVDRDALARIDAILADVPEIPDRNRKPGT